MIVLNNDPTTTASPMMRSQAPDGGTGPEPWLPPKLPAAPERHQARRALGARIAAARTAAGLTQEGLGRSTGVGQTVISRIESGLRRVDSDELRRLAGALGVDLSALVVDGDLPADYAERLRRYGDPSLVEALAWLPGFLSGLERTQRMEREAR